MARSSWPVHFRNGQLTRRNWCREPKFGIIATVPPGSCLQAKGPRCGYGDEEKTAVDVGDSGRDVCAGGIPRERGGEKDNVGEQDCFGALDFAFCEVQKAQAVEEGA